MMSQLSILLGTGILVLAYLAYLAIHRVFLSSVAHVPGPTLAKLTFWYVLLRNRSQLTRSGTSFAEVNFTD